MNASDITLATLIILVFVALYFINVFAIGIANIKRDWPKYRCNPSVMPFASMFGHDPVKNFTYCIQTMQGNYMGYLLQPLQYSMDVTGNLGKELNESIMNIRAFFNYIRNMITDIVQNVFGVFLNILIEFQKITIGIKDIFAKLVGLLAALMYIISGSFDTMNSMWRGPSGQLVRTVGKCFDPDSMIMLESGEVKRMGDVKLGDKLPHGGEVFATMELKNWKMVDGVKKQEEILYEIESSLGPLYVTGSHLAYDSEVKQWKKVADMFAGRQTKRVCERLVCLCTTNNLIPISGHIFHDWDDIDGKPVVEL